MKHFTLYYFKKAFKQFLENEFLHGHISPLFHVSKRKTPKRATPAVIESEGKTQKLVGAGSLSHCRAPTPQHLRRAAASHTQRLETFG